MPRISIENVVPSVALAVGLFVGIPVIDHIIITDHGFVSMAELGAVAVTQGPGLVGSLLVGVSFAKALAWARGLPVVPVHHLAGHIESLVLENGELPLMSFRS